MAVIFDLRRILIFRGTCFFQWPALYSTSTEVLRKYAELDDADFVLVPRHGEEGHNPEDGHRSA
jgi:hypothetical protein